MDRFKSHEAEGQTDAGPPLAPARDSTWAASQPLSCILLSGAKKSLPCFSCLQRLVKKQGDGKEGWGLLCHPFSSHNNPQSISDLKRGGGVLFKSQDFFFPSSRSQLGPCIQRQSLYTEFQVVHAPVSHSQIEWHYVAQAGFELTIQFGLGEPRALNLLASASQALGSQVCATLASYILSL